MGPGIQNKIAIQNLDMKRRNTKKNYSEEEWEHKRTLSSSMINT